MNIEKIPENGQRINRLKLTKLVVDIIDFARVWDDPKGEHFCYYCGHVWPDTGVCDHDISCIYLIAEEFVKEFNL